MPRRMDALSDAGPEAERHRYPRRLPLFQLGGSREQPRARRAYAPCVRLEFRFAARARPGDTAVADAPRAVSARLLLARTRWPHRPARRGVERARPLCQL